MGLMILRKYGKGIPKTQESQNLNFGFRLYFRNLNLDWAAAGGYAAFAGN